MHVRMLCAALGLCLLVILAPQGAQAQPPPTGPAGHDDALIPPPRPPSLTGTSDPRGPSQYMAGSVAVRVVLPESDGSRDASSENWSADQIALVRNQVQAALDWWANRLPLAHLRFHLQMQVVPSAYEPIGYGLDGEGTWIGNVLGHMGYRGYSYFDQAYAADDDLRSAQGADWATTIFVVNSAHQSSGYFPDGHFAYAYINGPFMVLTSDVGGYGADRMAPTVAHEFGHIFGALDQYAAAQVTCDRTSGYLNVPTSNSQYGGCGTNLPSIMIETIGSFANNQIDPSALAQVGYRDSDGDGLIDPLDTTPQLTLSALSAATPGERPHLSGRAYDQGFPAPIQASVSINWISAIEYRVNGGDWQHSPLADAGLSADGQPFDLELPLYDGDYQLDVRARNSMGGASPTRSQQFSVRGIGPQPDYRLSAPQITASRQIGLQLAAPAATQAVQLSADPGFVGAAWQSYQPAQAVELAEGDGVQTLYVRFSDADGRSSLAYALPVRLDTQPPEGTARRSMGSPDQIILLAHDAGAGVSAVELHIGATTTAWLPYQPTLRLSSLSSLATVAANAAISVRFRDAAGNISAPQSISVSYSVYMPMVVR